MIARRGDERGGMREYAGSTMPRTESPATQLLRWGPAGCILAALAAVLITLAVGGGAAPLTIGDPGPLVRWGLPVLRLGFDLSAALTVGGLSVVLFACSREKPEFERGMSLVQGGAIAWTISSILVGVLTYLDVSAVPFSGSADFGVGMWFFFTNLELGQMWLMATVMIAALTMIVVAVRSKWGILLATALAFLCLWPVATLGHVAGAASHELAVGALTLHFTGAAVWAGGLIAVTVLVWLGRRDEDAPARRLALIERYSSLALIAFFVVAGSGFVTTVVNVGDLSRLFTTAYGGIVITKILLLCTLGGFGILQRRFFIDRMRAQRAGKDAGTGRPLTWLLTLELVVMGAVSGVATALGRSPSPQPQLTADQLPDPTPAEILSGDPLPPPFTASRLLTEWSLDPLWSALAIIGLIFYVLGMRRMIRRGDGWPWWRAVAVTLGVLLFLYNVNGPLYVYGRFLFSFHMTEHMVLSMIVPIFLVIGAPMTLLLRACHPRKDGSLGGREWALLLVHSRWGKFFAHPIVAGINFAIALLVFYYTPLFRWATYDHVGHMWMILHFLIVGYLFVESIIGDDPARTRASYPLRLISLILVMTFHAFFGLSVMTGTGLLVADWYGATGRDWGPVTALADQQLGGGIAWGIGEFPTVILAVIVGLQWFNHDEKRARREDRRADRDEDAALREYNERLRKLAERDGTIA